MTNSLKFTLLFATSILGQSPAFAQVIERNLPPGPVSRAREPEVPAPLTASEDATPFGFDLARIVVLGAADPIVQDGTAAIDVSRVARLDTVKGRELLARYIGKPMSRRLISEIEADIARYYRAEGFPFVSLSTPEQEITTGVLNIRVVEFTAGTIKAEEGRTQASYIENSLRQQAGKPIDEAELTQDLDWLNRNPFRQVEAVFSPGTVTGQSNLSLTLRETKPWRVYAGASNSGSRSDRERLFAGFQAAPFKALPDALLSYQFTGSTDIFDTSRPTYVSHAGLFNLVIAPRQAIEATVNHVRIRQTLAPFFVDQKVAEGSIGLRQAAGPLGDMRSGIELRHSRRHLYFFDIPIDDTAIDVRQFYIGLEQSTINISGRSDLNVAFHISPGGLGAGNSDAAVSRYTAGRVTDSRYAYLNAAYSQFTKLGWANLGTDIIGQYATGPLPDSEQMGLGGQSLVRGYGLDDGGYDSGIVIRNTLFGQALPLLQTKSLSAIVQPYIFADGGYGNTRRIDEAWLAAVGGGFNFQVDRLFHASLESAYALLDGPRTQAKDWRINFSVTLSY